MDKLMIALFERRVKLWKDFALMLFVLCLALLALLVFMVTEVAPLR